LEPRIRVVHARLIKGNLGKEVVHLFERRRKKSGFPVVVRLSVFQRRGITSSVTPKRADASSLGGFYLLRQFKEIQMQILNIEKLSAVYGGNAPIVRGSISQGEQKVLDNIEFSMKTTTGLEQQAWTELWSPAFWKFLNN
jgi:hypothetical protein